MTTNRTHQKSPKGELGGLTFQYLKPFRTSAGNIVTMKALITMHGVQYVEIHEDEHRYPVSELHELTPEEATDYYQNINNKTEEDYEPETKI